MTQAKELLRQFRKSCQNERALIEIELFFVECGLDFLGIFGESDREMKELLITNYVSAVARILEDGSELFFPPLFLPNVTKLLMLQEVSPQDFHRICWMCIKDTKR